MVPWGRDRALRQRRRAAMEEEFGGMASRGERGAVEEGQVCDVGSKRWVSAPLKGSWRRSRMIHCGGISCLNRWIWMKWGERRGCEVVAAFVWWDVEVSRKSLSDFSQVWEAVEEVFVIKMILVLLVTAIVSLFVLGVILYTIRNFMRSTTVDVGHDGC